MPTARSPPTPRSTARWARQIGGSAASPVSPDRVLPVPKATKNADAAKKFIKCAYDHNDLGIESKGLAARIGLREVPGQAGYESSGR
ncbi:hypothetical protein LJR013_000577 [Pseudarthrobacter oxydans]